jgi:UDP-glucose 4-epimerase
VKIAVTGGAGFIGQAVVARAEALSHEVWICDRDSGCDVLGDLNALEGSECVIHLAGVLGTHELFDAVDEAVEVNVRGSAKVMQWCLEHNASYVGILMPDVFPSIYTATKVATKRIADALHHSRGLKVSHVRAFNAYGPGQKHGARHPQKILPTFATEAWNGRPLPIWGSGEQTVDLIHTDDLAKMLVQACDFVDNEVFDGGTGFPITVNSLARFVNLATMSQGGTIHYPMRRGEVETNVVAQGEGWDKLGWKPMFDAGQLLEAVRWYKPKPPIVVPYMSDVAQSGFTMGNVNINLRGLGLG